MASVEPGIGSWGHLPFARYGDNPRYWTKSGMFHVETLSQSPKRESGGEVTSVGPGNRAKGPFGSRKEVLPAEPGG